MLSSSTVPEEEQEEGLEKGIPIVTSLFTTTTSPASLSLQLELLKSALCLRVLGQGVTLPFTAVFPGF